MSHMHVQQKQEEKNGFWQIFLSSFPCLFRMQCSCIGIKKFEYYSFASIIFIVDQSVCCGLLWFDLPCKVVEMDKKKVNWLIDFVTNGEDSSNVDSAEEKEIVILPSIERAEDKTDCNSDISDDEKEGFTHICLIVCWQLLAQQTLSNKILMKAIKLVMMNHTSNILRDRIKTRKKRYCDIIILLIQMNYQQNYPTP